MIVIESRESAAFYRKLLLAYLIDSKPKMNAVALQKETGFPLRTVENNVRDMNRISIDVKYHGSATQGYYCVVDWGLFDKSIVYSEINNIRSAINDYLA